MIYIDYIIYMTSSIFLSKNEAAPLPPPRLMTLEVSISQVSISAIILTFSKQLINCIQLPK